MLVVSDTDSSVTRSGFSATWSTSAPSSCPAKTVADNFSSVAYTQNSGTENWTTNWIEIGESDGPSAGISRVNNSNCSSGNCLRIGEPSGPTTWSNRGAYREADLSSATSATLTFNYFTGRSQGSETVTLEISSNGGSSWTTLQTYNITGTSFSATPQTFDVSAYIAANTRIRFLSSGVNATIGMYVDDVQISYDVTCPVPAPAAEWRMDEASWNGTANEVVDNTSGGLHGTANGGASTDTSGKICAAGNFDGSNDFVNTSSVDTYLNSTASISFWIKTTQSGNNTNWLAPGIAGVESPSFNDVFWGWLDASGRIGIGSGDSGHAKSTTAVNDGNWHHIVQTRDSGTGAVQVYVDGALEHSNTSATGVISPSFSSIGRIDDTAGTPEYFQGQFDEVLIFDSVISASNVSSIFTNQDAGNNYDGTSRTCPVYGPDHFLINHDNNGIHCLGEAISVTARNADNSTMTTYTGTITLDTQTGKGSWSLVTGAGTLTDATSNDGLATYTFAAGDNGVASFSLDYTEGTATFNIDAYDGSVRDDDSEVDITFAASGFTVTASALSNPPPNPINDPIGTQTAGTAFNLHLAAFGTTPTNSQCGIIETYTGSKSISLTTNKVNPSAGTINATGGGSITFSNGQAVVSTKYKDVGNINITASDGTISGGTGNFVVRPATLEMTLGGSNQTAANHTGTIYTSAGTNFSVTVTAKDSEGSTTPNFGNESPAETIALAHTLAAPSGGATGTLTGNLSKTGSGVFSGNVNFSEVGIINLTADITDNNYLGTGNISVTSNNVGRFTPHQFAIGSLSNGALADSCVPDGGFSYTGQSFGFSSAPGFTITAQNAAGTTTANYTGNYAKLGSSSPSITGVTADTSTNGANGSTAMVISHTQTTPSLLDNSNGSHTYTLGADTFEYTRDSNSRVGSFNTDIDIRIASITDSDSVATAFGSGNVLHPTSTNIRYGRLSIANAIGSELVNLSMPAALEIFNGSVGDFVQHSGDSCTASPGYTVTDPDGSDSLNATSLTHSISTNTAGRFNITLNAPGTGSQGSALVTLNVPSYLQYTWTSASHSNPSAIGTFGLYSGTSPALIYRREIR